MRTKNSLWGQKLTREHPELGEKTKGFGWPEFGREAEIHSLKLQAERWVERSAQASKPSAEKREAVICKLVDAYKIAQTNLPNCCQGEELVRDEFMSDIVRAIDSLELDAGIGVPYSIYGLQKHRGWVEDPTLLKILVQLVWLRLKKLSQVSADELSPEERVRQNLCDPIRVFIKNEPHKQSKLDEGRYRLIMSVSLVDQLVARVLFQNQNKLEIKLWRSLPSKPGMGLSTDDQVLAFTESLAQLAGVSPDFLLSNWRSVLIPTDCSGFDWSVADWMLEDEMEIRNRLTKDCNSLVRKLRANWLSCIQRPVLSLTDGTLLSQQIPGVQKSGSYNTSSSNSRIRVMCALHAGASWCVAMGDDALESVDSDLSEYKNLGLKVEASDKLEFCSHVFSESGLAYPLNIGKTLYKLVYSYEPECGNLEVVTNYLQACISVLQCLRHYPELTAKLYNWLVTPMLPENNKGGEQ
uniref:RNA-directed RNA polymerase n=1 Tax=Cassava Polero-like virus TaxID=1427160 RepID=V9PRI7_9VIRU|nr:ORF2 [Cassava Polero-like virus]